MADHDRIYFARRAAEEQELAQASQKPPAVRRHIASSNAPIWSVQA